MFSFDWTINVNTLVAVLGFIVTAFTVFASLKGDVRVLKHDVSMVREQQKIINEAFSQLGKILTQVAVQDTRLSMMEKNIDELRHGQGFVRQTIA